MPWPTMVSLAVHTTMQVVDFDTNVVQDVSLRCMCGVFGRDLSVRPIGCLRLGSPRESPRLSNGHNLSRNTPKFMPPP